MPEKDSSDPNIAYGPGHYTSKDYSLRCLSCGFKIKLPHDDECLAEYMKVAREIRRHLKEDHTPPENKFRIHHERCEDLPVTLDIDRFDTEGFMGKLSDKL